MLNENRIKFQNLFILDSFKICIVEFYYKIQIVENGYRCKVLRVRVNGFVVDYYGNFNVISICILLLFCFLNL